MIVTRYIVNVLR